MAALIAVASLAVPVSTIATLTGMEMGGMSPALTADGYWLALAWVALSCSPRVRRRSSGPTGGVTPSTTSQGDA